MIERRANTRDSVSREGALICADRPALDCVVGNISDAGACMMVADDVVLPEDFALTYEGETHPCTLVWRHDGRIGVRFAGAPSIVPEEASDPLPELDCAACSGKMTLVHRLPACGDLPEVQAFRCADCGETLVQEVEFAT